MSRIAADRLVQLRDSMLPYVERGGRTRSRGCAARFGPGDLEKNEPNRAWARALDPGYRVPKPHHESAWYSTGELEKALGDAGLEEFRRPPYAGYRPYV